MREPFNRRRFVATSAGIGSFVTLGATGLTTLTGCKSRSDSQVLAEDAATGRKPRTAAAAATSSVRSSAADPNNKNVALYAKAIAAMQAKPFPRQIKDENGKLIQTDWWEAHALIHMNYCPHGNWFFVTWHRAYLVYFEKVIRKFCGDPSFALPYWDWSADAHLPKPFWSDPTLSHQLPKPNPRNYELREIKDGDAADEKNVGKTVIEGILATNDFISFAGGRSTMPRPKSGPNGGTGQLEGVPHNSTHGWIGGDMGAFLSPRDPIFWMHHCNVDRLWSIWQARQTQKKLSTLPPIPTAAAQKSLTSDWWLQQKLGTFYDATTGGDVFMTVKDTQSIAALGYQYENATTALRLTDDTAEVDTETTIDPTLQREIVLDSASAIEVDTDAQTVFMQIERSDAVMEVLGRVKDRVGGSDASQPNIRLYAENWPIPTHPATTRLEFYVMYGTDRDAERPTDVGSYSFFGHSHGSGEHASLTLVFDILPALKLLLAGGHDLAENKGPIQLLVHVVSNDDLPDQSAFKAIKLRVEYDEYG